MSRRVPLRDYLPSAEELRALLTRPIGEWRGSPLGTPALLCVASLMFAASLALAGFNARQAPAHPTLQAAPRPVAPVSFVPRGDVRVKPAQIPTPVFATMDGLEIHLPISEKAITLIAFHQAGSGRGSRHMRSTGDVVRLSTLTSEGVLPAGSKPATGPDETAEIAAAEATQAVGAYKGKVVRLYRTGRTGSADTAADVGAKGGTRIVSPVSGTVVAVHRYLLYGQYTDYEVHIIPTGRDRVDVTMLHLTDPAVKPGQQVVAGITPIGKVRWLSKLFESQLDEYTHDGGNHVHIQLDRTPRPGVVQLLGTQAQEGLPASGLTPRSPSPVPTE